MNWIKEIRLTIGFSQKQLAEYLSITRSYVAHIERGTRDLSTEGMRKMTVLQEIIIDHQITAKGIANAKLPGQDHGALLKTLTFTEQFCTLKAERFRYKLAALKGRYEEYLRTYPIMDVLYQNLPADKHQARNRKMIEVWKNTTNEKMESCGLPQQYALQRQIALLLADAEQARALIEKLVV